jgi:hypothetical protein
MNILLVPLSLFFFGVCNFALLSIIYANFNPLKIFSAIFLFGISYWISPYKPLDFLKNLHFGRAFFCMLLTGAMWVFSSGTSSPNWEVIPIVLGMYFLLSSIFDRFGTKK